MRSLTEQLSDHNDQADMTPLIDCVFLLLLFFIVAATFSEQTLFEVELPKAPQGGQVQVVDEEATTVEISKSGAFAIDKQIVPDEKLYDALRERHQKEPIQALLIQGDKQSPLEKAVLIIDVAHALDIGFSVVVDQ